MSDININITIDGEGEAKINGQPNAFKKKTKKIRGGTESVLQIPSMVESQDRRPGILDMMGL